MMTSYEAVRRTRAVLTEHGLPDAAFEGDILVQEVIGVRQPVRTLPERTLTEAQQETLADMTRRRCCHEPLQYLCGAWEFYGLPFSVGEGVLIPRQDTEVLVEEVLRLRRGTAATRLLDLCSGSGCIPAAVAVHLSGVTGDVVELSARALPYLAPGGVLVTATTAIQPVTAALASQPYRAGDVVAALANSLQAEASHEQAAETIVVPNAVTTAQDASADGVEGYPVPLFIPVDDEALVREAGAGSRKSLNMMLLAVAVAQGRVPLTIDEVKDAVRACVKPQFVAMNLAAIDTAIQAYG